MRTPPPAVSHVAESDATDIFTLLCPPLNCLSAVLELNTNRFYVVLEFFLLPASRYMWILRGGICRAVFFFLDKGKILA